MCPLREDNPEVQLSDLIVVRARPRGHVRMAMQQEGSFCIVSMWDHDKQLFGRALDSNKTTHPPTPGNFCPQGGG
jgi:hypothetical protein